MVPIALRWLALVAVLFGLPASAAPGDRLDGIRARGVLTCGVWPRVRGFAVERDGRYSGFDIDICRAVAAVVLGDADKVRFVMVSDIAQFLTRADVDMAVRRLTWTPNREAATGTAFGPVTFYDGQGFLVPKGTSAAQIPRAPVCVLNQEHHPETLASHFKGAIKVVLVDADDAAERALRNSRCGAYSADVSWLAAARAGFQEGIARYEILPDLISKEPLAPLVRAGDTGLLRWVRWTLYAMIDAEERGIGCSTKTISTRERALLCSVGNYGEVFNRNFGAASELKLDRGLNRLWSDGGLMYAPPLDR